MNISLLLSLLFFIINPLMGTLLSLRYLVNNERAVILIISLMAAICAYNVVPYDSMDLATHYRKFLDLKNETYSDIFGEGSNVFFYFYMKTLSLLNINKEWIPFSSTFVGYYILLSAFSQVAINGNSKVKIYTYYVLWFFTISFLSLSNGIRGGLSAAFFIGAMIALYNNRFLFFFISSVLSVLSHSFMLPVIIILLISKRINRLFPLLMLKLVIVVSIIIALMINMTEFMDLFVSQLSFIPGVDAIYKIYILGDTWGAAATFDFNSKLAMFLSQLPYFCSLFILVLSRTKNMIYICAVFTSAIALIFSDFWVISERYQYIVVLSTLIYLLSVHSKFYLSKNLLITLFCIMQVVALAWSIYRFRYVFIPTISFVIYPFLICFMKTVNLSKLIKV